MDHTTADVRFRCVVTPPVGVLNSQWRMGQLEYLLLRNETISQAQHDGCTVERGQAVDDSDKKISGPKLAKMVEDAADANTAPEV